jgi:hypothetical protein
VGRHGRERDNRTSAERPRQTSSRLTLGRDVRAIHRKRFGDRHKERQLFSTGAFFVTFATVRAITHAIRAERGSP